MSDTVVVALISAGGSVAVAVTALVLNYRGFASIDARFASLDVRFASLEKRIERLEDRFNAVYDVLVGKIIDHADRIARLEAKK